VSDQELNELTILLKIVEVIDRRWSSKEVGSTDNSAVGYVATVMNNYIAPSASVAFTGSGDSVNMRDKYEVGQAGAVGPNSSAQNMTFNQIWNQVSSETDLPTLAQQLAAVRLEMKRVAGDEPEQDISVAEIAQAEICAKSDDGPGVMQHLRKAGSWALEVATSIGTAVAASAIKSAIGIP